MILLRMFYFSFSFFQHLRGSTCYHWDYVESLTGLKLLLSKEEYKFLKKFLRLLMNTTQLREELQKRGMVTTGRRVDLIDRLIDALLPVGQNRPTNREEFQEALEARELSTAGEEEKLAERLLRALLEEDAERERMAKDKNAKKNKEKITFKKPNEVITTNKRERRTDKHCCILM